MIIYRGNLVINLDDNKEELHSQIEQLKRIKQLIVNSSAYCLLDGKTQMVDDKSNKKARSRLEHTINVATISKSVIERIYDLCSVEEISNTEVFKLNKQKAELEAEIAGLAHDLGHTPFGHNGEVAVNEFMQSIQDKEIINKIVEKRIKYFGEKYEEEQGHSENFSGKLSFEHNEQSALEFARILEESKENFDKVDINKIITAILSHSISRVPEVPNDLIAQIVRQADKVEYRNEDYEEIMQYIRYKEDERELYEYQSLSTDERIKRIIEDMAMEAVEKGRIDDENDALKKCKLLRKKYENVLYYLGEDGKRGLISGDNRERQQMICKRLLEYYYRHPEKIPTKSMVYNYPIKENKEKRRVVSFDKTQLQNDTVAEVAIRYVNSFTNEQCLKQYIKLVKERILHGHGFGIEPIKEEEIEKRKKIQISERVLKMRAKDIYKGIETHTYEEYVGMLHSKNKKFIENDVTEEASKAIQRNKILHQKENDEDKLLWEMVRNADKERTMNKAKRQMPERIKKQEDKVSKGPEI